MTKTPVRQERRGEARLPAVVAVLAAIALYALLPETLLLLPRLLVRRRATTWAARKDVNSLRAASTPHRVSREPEVTGREPPRWYNAA